MIGSLRADTLQHRLAWMLHRGSGVGVLLFLLIHVLDTALVRLGPQAYDTVVALYRQGLFRGLEIVLMAAVLFHGFNGVRITIQDLWGGWLRWQRPMLIAVYVLTALCWLPSAFFMAVR